MYDEATTSLGGEIAEKIKAPEVKKKPPTRAQRITAWRKANQGAYKMACEAHCTCTPTRTQMLLMNQWDSPPVD